jgi:tetratricopeptide (TPR) repeat protein
MTSLPVIVRDPRYVVGRATIGQSTAIDVFETLLHEAITRYGDDGSTFTGAGNTSSTSNTNASNRDATTSNEISITGDSNISSNGSIIETAPAYYEYGNALLRWAIRQREGEMPQHGQEAKVAAVQPSSSSSSTAAKTTEVSTVEASKQSIREAIAAAAERRAKKDQVECTSSTTTRTTTGTGSNAQPNTEQATNNNVTATATTFPDSGDVTGKSVDQNVASDNRKAESRDAAAVDDIDDIDATSTDENIENEDDDDTTSSIDNDDDNEDQYNDDDQDDFQLALEMMETSWSILDAYQNNQNRHHRDSKVPNRHKNYDSWVTEQIPRVLTGIGDALAALNRHADAVDAYLRALDHRQTILNHGLQMLNGSSDDGSDNAAAAAAVAPTTVTTTSSSRATNTDLDLSSQIQILKYRRQVVEVTVLVVEELLACREMDQDVVTTESEIVLVRRENVVEYARGYYDRARDELQETVVLLGQIVAMMPTHNPIQPQNHPSNTATTSNAKALEKSIQEEKENICYAATMIMGAGTLLAEIDEQSSSLSSSSPPPQQHMSSFSDVTEPIQKKSKSSK